MKLEDLKPYLKESLIVTPEHIRQAKGNKHNFIVEIPAFIFLRLTTSGNIENFLDKAEKLETYNTAAKEGENIIMPFLYIKGNKIVGHEGRHRAAAVVNSKGKYTPMKISIRYRPQDSEEEKKLAKKYGAFRIEYDVDFEDMPNKIYGQYNPYPLYKL